jgi:hypothetical protein
VAVGEVTPITADHARSLTVGDRDRLVLALRRLIHGERLDCVFACRCGERLELTLDVSTLLAGCDVDELPPRVTAPTPNGDELTLRPANGGDHERAARTALLDAEAASDELLAACIVDGGGRLTADVRALADALLAEFDPAAEITLAGACPSCGREATTTFDPIDALWRELERDRAVLESEVHTLALHYHWSEREIVDLPAARRARYIEQLDHHLAGL